MDTNRMASRSRNPSRRIFLTAESKPLCLTAPNDIDSSNSHTSTKLLWLSTPHAFPAKQRTHFKIRIGCRNYPRQNKKHNLQYQHRQCHPRYYLVSLVSHTLYFIFVVSIIIRHEIVKIYDSQLQSLHDETCGVDGDTSVSVMK